MKCSMILAAAAAAAPMAMAAEDAATCVASYLAAETAGSVAGACETDPKKCSPALQTAVDKVYADCGGLETGGVEWDTTLGPEMKKAVESCGCSGAAHAAPVFALAAAAMAFFA
jgi:hypothetical protein